MHRREAELTLVAPFAIDPTDRLPLYAQLDRSIRSAITTGRLRAGQRLPTLRQLALALGINANTVARVYLELDRDGIVETRRGVGTFVTTSPNRRTRRTDRELRALVDRFLAEAASIGIAAEELLADLAQRTGRTAP
jgi:GntR family transcriptional regulator